MSQIPFTDDIKVFWVLFPLILGALYFTIIFKFPGLRLFHIAVNTVRGKYEDVEELPSDLNVIDGDEPDTIRIEGAHGEVITSFVHLHVDIGLNIRLKT